MGECGNTPVPCQGSECLLVLAVAMCTLGIRLEK